MWYLNDINIKSTETKDLKLCLENVIRLKEMYGSMDYLNKVCDGEPLCMARGIEMNTDEKKNLCGHVNLNLELHKSFDK